MEENQTLKLMSTYLEILKKKSFESGIDFLTHFGIRNFLYDGNSIGLTTNKEWNGIIDENKLHDELKLHYKKELTFVMKNNFKYFLKTDSAANTPFLKKLSEVDMCNSMGVYRKNDKGVNAYFFTAPKFFHEATQIFFNKIEIFEKIVDEVEKLNVYTYNSEFIQPILESQDLLWFKKTKNLNNNLGARVTINGQTIILTDAEFKIFKLLAYPNSTKALSASLGISAKTVDWHINNIKRKIGIYSRNGLSSIAQKVFNKE